MERTENSLILVACSRGCTDAVMATAKAHGARGGTVIKALLCSAVMAVVVYGAHWLLAGVFASGSVGHRAVLVFVPMLVGVVVYFALAFALKADPLVQFLGNFRGRKGGNHEGPVSD